MGAKKVVKKSAKIYKKNEGVIYKSRGSENMLIKPNYKLGEDAIFILNSTSAFIWDSINGKRDVNKIAQLVSWNFKVDEDRAIKDVSKILSELEKFRLVCCLL